MIVEKEANLDFPLQDGSTKRSHLQSIAKQTGNIPAELEVPECPLGGLYIKNIFDQLALTREWTNGQPRHLSQANIYYWCKLNDVKLARRHLRTIQKLDNTQVNTYVTNIAERY